MTPTIVPSLLLSLVQTVFLLALACCVGRCLLGRSMREDDALTRLAASLTFGLLFLVGVCATWGLGRFSHLSLLPVLLIGFAMWSRRVNAALPKPVSEPLLAPVKVVVAVGFSLTWIWNAWWRSDGHIAQLNMDLGYFAQVAKGLSEAKVESVWAAVLGPHCLASGETSDVWYHWAPIWLTSGMSAVSGRSALETLLFIVAPALNIALIIVAGAIVARVTGWTARWSLVAGGASLIALSFPSMAQVVWLAKVAPAGAVQHVHVSLAYQFSYKFEAILVLTALLCWLRHRLSPAILLLFCAGLSAPHTVASGGITAGMLGLFGLLRRDARQYRLAAGMIGILVLAWAVSRLGFGVDLPKADTAKLIDLQASTFASNLGQGLIDILAGTLVALLVIPGIIHCARAKEAPEIRLLGWIAVSALTGAYLAFHLLMPDGDRSHFITYAHAFLVIPIGFWGLARLASFDQGAIRYAAIAAMVTTTGFGIYDMSSAREEASSAPYSETGVAQIKEALGGRPFGYFASQDRNWWISKNAVLAGLLDSRGVRLNQIDSVDVKTGAARFYRSSRPLQLAPSLPGESPDQWSLRLARALGIRHVLEIGRDTAPAALSARLHLLVQAPGIRLLEIRDTPDSLKSPNPPPR